MSGFADMHCHLCPGLDDGPKTLADALEMCRIAWEEGTRSIAATCHQSETWPGATPEAIRAAVQDVRRALADMAVPIAIHPTAEIMLRPGLEEAWQAGELVSVADGGKYLLIELPGGTFVEMRPLIESFLRRGLRTIVAHPERHPELLHDKGRIEGWIAAGALVQVSTGSLVTEMCSADQRALRQWARRGMIHLLGSDGHSPRRRAPRFAAAFERLSEWIGRHCALQIARENGNKVFAGEDLIPTEPAPAVKRSWFAGPWFP